MGSTRASVVGQAGVEYSYDSLLRGQDGELQQSYDASGHAVGQAYLAKAPTPGPTLQLTIDYRLQRVAQSAIAYGIQVARNDGEVGAHTGALVAMDPEHRRDLRDGLVPQLRPVRIPASGQACDGALQRQVQPAAGRQDAVADRARLDLQADHRGGGLERGSAGPRFAARLPRGVRAQGRHLAHEVPKLEPLRQRRHQPADGARDLLRHLLLPARQQVLRPAQPGHRLPAPDPPLRLRHHAGDRPAGAVVVGRTGARSAAWRLQHYPDRASTRSGSPATTSRWRSARAI